jgi:cell division protein FtsZ
MGMGMMGSGRSSGEHRAAEAAQAAIASPLLEDVNLAGAKGILVNVTGANMTLGEFQDIGDVISSFSSEDATVVMGTAIDEMLEDQIRVTVVATGLGHPHMPQAVPAKPKIVKSDGAPDYEVLDKPTVMRRKEVPDVYDEELLDIPAFLRRQAD